MQKGTQVLPIKEPKRLDPQTRQDRLSSECIPESISGKSGRSLRHRSKPCPHNLVIDRPPEVRPVEVVEVGLAKIV